MAELFRMTSQRVILFLIAIVLLAVCALVISSTFLGSGPAAHDTGALSDTSRVVSQLASLIA